MPTVAITGVAGFLGCHLVLAFLEAGYTVRGILRDGSKIQDLLQIPGFKPYLSQLSFHAIPQFDNPELAELKTVIQGVDAIVNAAAPLPSPTKQFQEIEAESKGIIVSIVKVAASTPSVKTLVHISTMGTVIHLRTPPWEQEGHVNTEDEWFDYTSEELQKLSDEGAANNGWFPAPGLFYFGAKATAEKSAVQLVKDLGSKFSLAVLTPDVIFGPPIHPMKTVSSVGTSMTGVLQFVKGTDTPVPSRTPLPSGVDVRDVAQAAVKAVEHQADGRFLVSGGKYSFQLILDILRAHFPQETYRMPVGNPGKYETPYTSDVSKSVKELGLKYHTFEQTIVDQFARILELEKSGIALA